jgi:hypothetical protein
MTTEHDWSLADWTSEAERQAKVARLFAKLAQREGEKVGQLAAKPVILLGSITMLLMVLVAIEGAKLWLQVMPR